MIDTGLLRGEIFSHGDNQGKLADALGITESSLSMRMNGKLNFSHGEIECICKRYGIESEKLVKIFYPELIAKT